MNKGLSLSRLLQRLIGQPLPWPARYFWSTVIVLLVAVLRGAIGLTGLPFLLFVPALMLVSLRFGLGAGCYATVLSALLAAFLFIGTPYDLALTGEQWVLVVFYAVINLGIVAICSVLRDTMTQLYALTDQLERQVVRRTADRDRLWQLSADIMLVANLDGTVQAVNPAWTDMLGWSEAELVGHTFSALLHPDDVAATLAVTQGTRNERRPARFENRYRHRDGSYRWITWSAAAGDGFIIAVGRNSTEEKEQASALDRVEQQLRQSQKMEAVGQLTGGIAHDFNNLLTGITGSLELIRTRLRQNRHGELERFINVAQGAADRAAALTHRLLAFSRQQTLDPKPTDVDQLVAGMAEMVRRTVGPGIELEVRSQVEPWTVLVDPNQLENALLNLCINARDAMPDGGRLCIETANLVLDEAVAREGELPPGEYLALAISDTGIGMDEATRARVFEPFFTTKPLGQGTGLGLSMVYGFVRQSGGQVRVRSLLGQGTTASITLPRHDAPSEKAPAPAHPTELAAAPRNKTVMVVDDEPTIRLLVTEVLQGLGYAVVGAGDGAGGLDVLRTGAPVDVLVTDVGLPGGMNGRQLADAGRALHPGLKVLFITGYAESAVLSHGHLEPGMQIITKPFTMEVLASRVRALVTGA